MTLAASEQHEPRPGGRGSAASTVLDVDSDTARRLKRAARKIQQATDERDRAILEAHAQKATLREIAALAELSHGGVADVIRRKGRSDT